MGRIDGLDALDLGLEQRAGDFAKPVAAVAHGQQVQRVLRPRPAPAARDGLRGGGGGEGAFELVGNDQDVQRHEEGSKVRSLKAKVKFELQRRCGSVEAVLNYE